MLIFFHFPLQSSSGSSRDVTAHVLELKLKALILDTVHNIDIVQMLVRDNIRSTGNWLWQKQLRCYLSKGTYSKCINFMSSVRSVLDIANNII